MSSAAAPAAPVSAAAPAGPHQASAESPGAELDAAMQPTRAWSGPSLEAGRHTRIHLLPGSDLYPRYIADPRFPRVSLSCMFVSSDIEGTGDAWAGLSLGTRIGLLRLHPRDEAWRGLQLDADAAIVARFDLGNSLDNIGWDGFYAVGLSARPARPVALRLAYQHLSSHLGDELLERIGRERINNNREEVVFGVAVSPLERAWLYAEAGWAFDLGAEEADPWRVKAGAQYESPPIWLERSAGWYIALDVTWWEENDWRQTITAQAGLYLRGGLLRRFRLGIEAADGRSVLAEFFEEDETRIGIGVWIDI